MGEPGLDTFGPTGYEGGRFPSHSARSNRYEHKCKRVVEWLQSDFARSNSKKLHLVAPSVHRSFNQLYEKMNFLPYASQLKCKGLYGT